jgi:hypothetical protein
MINSVVLSKVSGVWRKWGRQSQSVSKKRSVPVIFDGLAIGYEYSTRQQPFVGHQRPHGST